jgi:hypothetical protein
MENEKSDFKVFGPEHMRMIELPLSEVMVDPAFNCRGVYSVEEITQACEAFEHEPMLHPPTVARVGEQWMLIAGFLRFAVWQVKRVDVGVFRWIEADDARKLALTNVAENMLRNELRPHEIVDGIARLRELGIDAEVIGKACKYSKRWVNRLYAFKRSAHPELWDAFVAHGGARLSMRRALDLADHRHEEQPRRLRQVLKVEGNADDIARGYPDPDAAQSAQPEASTPRTRRRYPSRRHARQVEKLIELEPMLRPDYRKGLLDMLRWFLFRTEFPFKVSLAAAAAEARRQREGAAEAESGEHAIAGDDEDDRVAE